MSLLFNIISAAYARGTHHKLALDALGHLEGADAEGWRRVFMAHAPVYMSGSKAPDDEFKDFQNHVLHVRDGFWGGAADKVENWYGHLVKALKGERWSEAVWAAGVLSHYYTDPIHPFHSAQSEAENNIHRAAEWSISRSYDELRRQGQSEFAAVKPVPGTGTGWLRQFVVAGAETGNKHYEKLIAHYDINSGVVDPPSGLDVVSRRLVAELITYASKGFAALLSRAIAEAGVRPPQTGLALAAARALLNIPRNKMLARSENAAERRLIEAMYDELKATGRVEKSLPEDERVVREMYDRDVLAPMMAERDKARADVVALPPPYSRSYTAKPGEHAAVPPAPAGEVGAMPAVKPAPAPAPVPVAAVSPPAAPVQPAAAPPAPTGSVIPVAFGDSATPRIYLLASDDVERAPSIGPKMAERLYAQGVKTVADLFAANPEALAEALDVRQVSDETIVDWQDQSRLVSTIPGLRGTHAQLLVGAGYRSRDAVAAAAADKLCADVLSFAVSADGQRILRDGSPPDMERIKGWLTSARAAKVA